MSGIPWEAGFGRISGIRWDQVGFGGMSGINWDKAGQVGLARNGGARGAHRSTSLATARRMTNGGGVADCGRLPLVKVRFMARH